MEDFKRIIKMKTGGSVSQAIAKYEKRERKSEEKADIAQDKAIVKKAIAMHDKQEHPGEKTNLSKLKKGGRTKKEVGTVKKFEKASGEYGAKKGAADIKRVKEAKQFKPKKLQAGGRPLQDPGKPANTVNACQGGKIKKYATGGSIDDDVRARAMKWIESGSPEQAEAPSAAVKPVKRAKAVKLPMPDYSNEDLDRMDAEIAERTRRSKRTPRQMLEEESEYTIKPDLQVKGERLMKAAGLKCGGKAKKMNTGGTCS